MDLDETKIPPHLLASLSFVDVTDKEKAAIFIEMQINMLSTEYFSQSLEYAVGHTQGLILGYRMSGLITEKEAKVFNEQVFEKRRQLELSSN